MKIYLQGFSGFSRFYGGQEGSISITSALFMSTMLAAAGFALDAGSLRLEKQTAQSAVDLAAIAAAANLNKPEAAAKGSLAANKISRIVSVIVTKGHYTADTAIAPAARFKANIAPLNAVQVTLRKTGKQYFSQLFTKNPMTINVTGVAATSAETTFSLGSRLASVHDGVPNRVLSGLLGGNVALSINDYNALAQADVTAFDFLNALATSLHVTSGSYQDVLNANANVGNVLTAIATAAGAHGDAQAAAAINLLKTQSNDETLAIPLNNLISLGSAGSVAIGQSSPGLDAAFNALELINGAAKTANANKQVAVDLNAIVPGLLSLKLDISIGEPPHQSPWVRVGQKEATLYQAATRIRLVAEVGGSGLLAGVRLKLPIYIALGSSQARLDDIACSGGDIQQSSVTIGTLPGAAEAWIGEISNAALQNLSIAPTVADATIANVAPLVKITGKAHALFGAAHEVPLNFDYSDIQAERVKSTSGSSIASVVQSLVSSLQLTVTALGLNVANVKTSVLSSFTAVAAPIDAVLQTVLTSLGLHIGEADVRVHGIRCDGGVLVN